MRHAGRRHYYVMCDIADFGFANDIDLQNTIREIGVAVVPGSSFYHDILSFANGERIIVLQKTETR